AEDGIRDFHVTGVQTCALPIFLGQRSGLFVLFFTEMWERFSFYGMRVLLIQFLTAKVIFGSPNSGWEWSAEQAGALYGTYAMMLYLTPIIGGIIADKYVGSCIARSEEC